MVERDGPWQAAARADWLRLNLDASQPDLTPLIDATHQRYPDDAEPPTGAVGGGSIYTADASADAVAGYVESAREASYEQAAACLADIADPALGAGFPVTIAEDVGDRIVLGPLSATRPNVVDYDDIAGAALLQFSPGPEPGVPNPLVIRVPAGTTEVVGARVDPQGAYSPYIMWDLSALTGEVSVTAAQARIDGSIYAPDADITVTASPLDGQIIGRNVTTGGGEVHSFFFAGAISCAADEGTFRIRKALEGIDPAAVAGVTFAVNYTATTPSGDEVRGSFELPADGTWVPAGEDFPVGTVVEFAEIPPASIPGYEWAAPVITPDPLVVTAGATADVVVTNEATPLVGTFSVSKRIATAAGPLPDVPDGSVEVTWTATRGGAALDSGVLEVPFDGTPASPDEQFPLGTRITLSEDLSSISAPDGYRWTSATWDPGRVITIADTGTAAVVLTNTVAPEVEPRSISVVKHTVGAAGDLGYAYSVSYNIDPVEPGTEARRTREIAVGEPVVLTDVETGAQFLRLAEPIPLLDGEPVDVSDWEAPVFRVATEGGIETFTAGGFEGQVPLEDAVVDIPLPASGDISVEVTNELREGTFAVQKRFEGIVPDDLPDGTLFTAEWTATTPDGEVTAGRVRVPVDGAPVSPLDASGDPLLFPYGTVVEFREAPAPLQRGVTWVSTSFTPGTLTIGDDDAAVAVETMTNAATFDRGTFQVAKDLAGVTPEQLSTDTFLVGYLALLPTGAVDVGTIVLPADGTPVGPLDDAGAPRTFPVGTRIVLAEAPPDEATLPEDYDWARPTWSPSRSLTIAATEQTPTIVVTNSAVQYAMVSLTKTVDDAAGLVADDVAFDIAWWLDDERQPDLTLAAGETVASDRFPVGSIIEAEEPRPADVPGGTWQDPVWTLDGEVLPVQSNGRVVVPVSASGQQTIAIVLENILRPQVPDEPAVPDEPGDDTGTPDAAGSLPTTGGSFSPLLPAAGILFLLLGSALVARRRRV
ncbi:DUF5979 domain-containing protein [Microbacterium sp. NM3R9]|uniref:DUF5979 domain-containing protein n=1 Tax=Microbacterium thalli TaxID=3027921 RepID=UPI002365E82B|nr:DUF5979 domain-containing protein [Microbacterium thalli]MDN8548154.1 DUF5979 domain-containing protein [Microbacterium thalli]